MSIKHYQHVWKNYPGGKGSHKLVFLALAEFANDETDECWPSISRLANMAGLSDRQIQKILRDLEQSGHIEIQTNHGRRNTNIYKIIIVKVNCATPLQPPNDALYAEKGEPCDTFEAAEKVNSSAEKVNSSAEKVNSSAEKVNSSAQKGEPQFTRTVIEPLTEPEEEPEKLRTPPVIDGAAVLMDIAKRRFEHRQQNGSKRSAGWQAELNKQLEPTARLPLAEALAKACGLTVAMADDTIFRDLNEYAIKFYQAGYKAPNDVAELKTQWMADMWRKTNHPMPGLLTFFKFASQMAELGVRESTAKPAKTITIFNQYTNQYEERKVS